MTKSKTTAEQPTCLPSDLMDEMIPSPRNSPDDWIGSMDDGAPAIIAGVDDGGTAEKICLLRDGELVKFCSMTTHGSAVLTLKSGGQWSVDNPMPWAAEQVCAINGWQIDSFASSVEECTEALFDYEAKPGDYDLSYYTWADGISFVFDAGRQTFKRREQPPMHESHTTPWGLPCILRVIPPSVRIEFLAAEFWGLTKPKELMHLGANLPVTLVWTC